MTTRARQHLAPLRGAAFCCGRGLRHTLGIKG